jgi:hypothetical protein
VAVWRFAADTDRTSAMPAALSQAAPGSRPVTAAAGGRARSRRARSAHGALTTPSFGRDSSCRTFAVDLTRYQDTAPCGRAQCRWSQAVTQVTPVRSECSETHCRSGGADGGSAGSAKLATPHSRCRRSVSKGQALCAGRAADARHASPAPCCGRLRRRIGSETTRRSAAESTGFGRSRSVAVRAMRLVVDAE